MASRAVRAAVWSPPAETLAWGGVALAAAAAAALGVAPPLILFTPVLLACAAGILSSPLLFLWILVAFSGVGIGWQVAEALSIGGATIRTTGLRWGIVLMAGTAILVRWGGLPRVPKAVLPYALLVGLALAGIAWTPDRFEGLKNALQFATPLVLLLVACRTLVEPTDDDRLRSAFWVGLALAAAAAFVIGDPTRSGELRVLDRALGPFLVPFGALALAAWRYRGGAWLLAVLAVFALVLLTLSRTSIAVLLVLTVLAVTEGRLRRALPALLLGLAAALLVLQYDPLRARLFAGAGSLDLGAIGVAAGASGAELQLLGLDMTGRGLTWLLVFGHALEAPWLGHGTGAASAYLVASGIPIAHPHNEYLRIFHDLGIVGLGLLVWFGWRGLRFCVEGVRRGASDRTREACMAGGLALVGYLLAALFDNVMVYATVYTPSVFLLLGLAISARAREPEPSHG